MNISDFVITVLVSLLTGIGLGLTIKSLGYVLIKILSRKFGKSKAFKPVEFEHFFGKHNKEAK